jgi:hypothetical protein
MTTILKDILTDLREKRLWPLALILLAALVAVPLLLAKGQSRQVAANPAPTVPAAPGLPVVSAQTTPAHSHLTGPARDPFVAPSSGSATAPTVSGATSTIVPGSVSTLPTGGASGAQGGAGSSATTVTLSSSAGPPTSIIAPKAPSTPAPTALTPTQTYDVSLAITNSSGGLDTLEPLERLTPLPSARRPLLVELGVLQGGGRVLFAVQPGAVVNGPGACTPGPIDCEILSLAVDQTESLSQLSGSVTEPVALLAVTSIRAVDHGSPAAADGLRRRESAAGRALLRGSPLAALALFRYEPSLGVVVDLRNLTVGVG